MTKVRRKTQHLPSTRQHLSEHFFSTTPSCILILISNGPNMNRSNSAMTDGDHSPMREQLVLFQSQSGSLSVLKSPTKRSDVLHARHGVDENSKRGKQPARNESDEARILRSQVEQYQQQLRFLERESAEHRSAAIKTRERALQLLKTYDQMTQLANKEQGYLKKK